MISPSVIRFVVNGPGLLLALLVVLGSGACSGARPGVDQVRELAQTTRSLAGMNLKGLDLAGVDLRGVDLRGADLTGARLNDADLGGADLESADLEDANLVGANLEGANLFGATVRGTKFAGARFAAPESITWWPVFPREALSFLAPGTTVRAEVVRRLHLPAAAFDGGRIVVYRLIKHRKGLWVSVPRRGSTGDWGTEEYSLVLVFNPDGRLRQQTLKSMKTLAEDPASAPRAADPLAFLVDGKTSKAEVLDQLGLPSAEFEGERILTYRIGTSGRGVVVAPHHAGDWKDVRLSLVLVFDERQVLRRHARIKVD